MDVAEDGASTLPVADATTWAAAEIPGCGRRLTTGAVDNISGGRGVDADTDSRDLAAELPNDISVLNGKSGTASAPSRCGRKPVRVLPGRGARGLSVDEPTDTLHVPATASDPVSLIDRHSCDRSAPRGGGQGTVTALVGTSRLQLAVVEPTNTIDATNAHADPVIRLDGRTWATGGHAGA
ncbi:MAG TPA: hypothetical protein VMW47_11105 [Verrucomicrobiae bacterium]|nr:hypothetical protein [Verrucomicrobiae bacterium]